VSGSSFLVAVAFFHKFLAGLNPYDFPLKVYLFPFIVGGLTGAALAAYNFRLKKIKNELFSCIDELNKYFELSLYDDTISISKWRSDYTDRVKSHCYEAMNCNKTGCNAYESECGRCWLQVGTLCDDNIQDDFESKRNLCTNCKVYKDFVGNDLVKNLRELTFSLIENLNLQKQKLKQSIDEIKILRGVLPICASCKKIRDDEGYWNRIESYISTHSEAEFTHSYCNDCINKLYPDIADQIITETTL